jgi:predicted methyltransferase
MQSRALVPVLLSLLLVGCGSAPATPAQPHDHHPGTVHHSFADTERWAREFDAPDRDAWQKPDEVVALMGIAPGMHVVDLGAGTGYFVGRLSRAVGPQGKVIALDVEPKMVDYMKQRAARESLANVDARPVDPNGADLPPSDRVLIVDTWHHLGNRTAYAKKLFSSLRSGGAVIVVDFTEDSPKGPPPAHRLSAAVVERELAAGGFATELARESLPHQYVVIARKR